MRIESAIKGIRGFITRRPRVTWLAVSAVVLCFGALRLPTPVFGDQAVFLLGADSILDGQRFYIDFWDCKQPGVFIFYAVGMSLFGHSLWGVHLFELLVNVAFCIALVLAVNKKLRVRELSVLVPLATIGTYYAMSSSAFQTQVEALVPPWIFMAAWACSKSIDEPEQMRWHLITGFAAGIVACFKLVLAPVPFLMWIATCVAVGRLRKEGAKSSGPALSSRSTYIVKMLIAAGLGAVIPLTAMAAWCFANGSLNELIYVSFGYPLEYLGEGKKPPFAKLLSSLGTLAGASGVWLVLAFFSPASRGTLRREWIWIMCAVWFVAGLGMIAAQRTSWHDYHMQLLFVPAALLGIRGLDAALVAGLRRPWIAATGSVIAITGLMFLAGRFVILVVLFFNAMLSGSEHKPVGFGQAMQPWVENSWRQAAPLRETGNDHKTVYVFGDPNVLWMSDRSSVMPVNGWSWEYMPERIWKRLEDDFGNLQPELIMTTPEAEFLLGLKSELAVRLIDENYERFYEKDGCFWYKRVGD